MTYLRLGYEALELEAKKTRKEAKPASHGHRSKLVACTSGTVPADGASLWSIAQRPAWHVSPCSCSVAFVPGVLGVAFDKDGNHIFLSDSSFANWAR